MRGAKHLNESHTIENCSKYDCNEGSGKTSKMNQTSSHNNGAAKDAFCFNWEYNEDNIHFKQKQFKSKCTINKIKSCIPKLFP